MPAAQYALRVVRICIEDISRCRYKPYISKLRIFLRNIHGLHDRWAGNVHQPWYEFIISDACKAIKYCVLKDFKYTQLNYTQIYGQKT